MRADTHPVTGMDVGAAVIGIEERSDETPRAEGGQDRPAPTGASSTAAMKAPSWSLAAPSSPFTAQEEGQEFPVTRSA